MFAATFLTRLYCGCRLFYDFCPDDSSRWADKHDGRLAGPKSRLAGLYDRGGSRLAPVSETSCRTNFFSSWHRRHWPLGELLSCQLSVLFNNCPLYLVTQRMCARWRPKGDEIQRFVNEIHSWRTGHDYPNLRRGLLNQICVEYVTIAGLLFYFLCDSLAKLCMQIIT